MTPEELEAKLSEAERNAVGTLESVNDSAQLEDFRLKFMGKKGEVTAILSQLGQLDKADRSRVGAVANTVKSNIESAFETKKRTFYDRELNARLSTERIDVTLPGTGLKRGHIHPLTQITNDIIEIFYGMGFSVADGPEVETDYYNFDALNTPDSHPARDSQDTFTLT